MNGQYIREAVLDQKEERERILGGKMVRREALDHWSKFVDSDIVKVATGVRRSGKTVFSHLLLEGRDMAFVNFDDERLAFLRKEELNSVVKALYEVHGDFKYLLPLTGSRERIP